jgi:hypothetical protein
MLEVRDELTELLRMRAVRDCGKVGKTLMLQIMNGAKFTRGSGAIHEVLREIECCDEVFEIVEARTAGFVRRLNEIRSRLLEHVTPDFRLAVMKPGVDLVARVVSILSQNIERIIVTKYVHFLLSRCREVTAVIHDGVLFTKQAQDEVFPHDLALLGKEIILQDTGFDLQFNHEKFELPEKDSWRLSEIEEIELPPDLKNFFKACNYINVNNVIVNYHGSEVDDGEVDIDLDHLEWFKSMFCYLLKPGKYYEYETRILYTKEEFINRCIDKETVVQYYDKTKKKTVTRKHESVRLWIKDRSRVQSYYDLTHVMRSRRFPTCCSTSAAVLSSTSKVATASSVIGQSWLAAGPGPDGNVRVLLAAAAAAAWFCGGGRRAAIFCRLLLRNLVGSDSARQPFFDGVVVAFSLHLRSLKPHTLRTHGAQGRRQLGRRARHRPPRGVGPRRREQRRARRCVAADERVSGVASGGEGLSEHPAGARGVRRRGCFG